MVVLVTGANGQLGQALQSIAGKQPTIEFRFCTSADLDITDKESIEAAFKAAKPDFCINAAAYTAVDKSETEPDKAYAVNVSGVKNVAEVCKEFGTTLVHVSTDFVFDGHKKTPYTENDPTNPQGIYGKTKLEGELALQQTCEKYFIIRTSWVYSQFGNNFMKTMLRLASERTELGVVNDQIGTPTHAVDLAEAIVSVILSGSTHYGIYNFSNEGIASWYDFAKQIFDNNGAEINLRPIATADFPTPARRPSYSVLDKTKIKTEFGIPITDWQVSLARHQ